jgi:hypothetical protein
LIFRIKLNRFLNKKAHKDRKAYKGHRVSEGRKAYKGHRVSKAYKAQ